MPSGQTGQQRSGGVCQQQFQPDFHHRRYCSRVCYLSARARKQRLGYRRRPKSGNQLPQTDLWRRARLRLYAAAVAAGRPLFPPPAETLPDSGV